MGPFALQDFRESVHSAHTAPWLSHCSQGSRSSDGFRVFPIFWKKMGGGSARKLQQGTVDHSCLRLRPVLTHPALPILIFPGQIVPVWLLISAFGSCPNDDRVRYFSPSPPPPHLLLSPRCAV